MLSWKGTKNGVFTVKSAYHMAKMKENQEQVESSSRDDSLQMWGAMWRLPIQNSEKNFLWKACHEILPTKVSLHKRKIVSDKLCPICGIWEETCFHILWECPSARDIWSGSLKKFQKSSFRGLSFKQVVAEMFRICEDEELCRFGGIARRIWLRRNEVIHDGPFMHPKILLQQAGEAWDLFVAANKSPQPNIYLKKLDGVSSGCSLQGGASC
jgi:hypothetical protein